MPPPPPPTYTRNGPALPHDVYLIVTFASLSCAYSATSHLPAIAAAARKSNNLLVQIKLSSSPFSATQATSTPSLPTNSAAGPFPSGSAEARPPPASSSGPGSAGSERSCALAASVTEFEKLQAFLSRVYSAATRAFLERDRPLAKVEVVMDHIRRVPLCVPAGAEVERITVEDETSVAGKGKGKSWEGEEGGEGGDDWDESTRREGYAVAALGGTFDHLHAGHRILLTLAAAIIRDGGRLITGISDTNLLQNKKHPTLLQPLAHRIAAVRDFLVLICPTVTHDVVPIQDVYGPTATDPTIEALVVSDETVAGGQAINALRAGKGLVKLAVWVIKLVGDDGGAEGEEGGGQVGVAGKMGSTAIRAWLAAREEEGTGQV